MFNLSAPAAAVLSCLAFSLTGCVTPAEQARNSRIAMDTARGSIVILLHEDKAPQSSSFIRDLVAAGRFDGTSFYRVGAVAGPVETSNFVEGGMLSPHLLSSEPTTVSASGLPTLATLETTDRTGLRHQRGAVSLARDVLETGVAIPDIVIYLSDAPEADAGGNFSPDGLGYPVFGHVLEGIEILDQIAIEDRSGETWAGFLQGQILTTPLVIERAVVR